MSAEEVRAQRPKAWRIYEMHVAGVPRNDIAVTMRIGRSTVDITVNEVIRLLKAPPGRTEFKQLYPDYDVHRPRCRCGLMLPCDDCLPGITEYAGLRKGRADGLG